MSENTARPVTRKEADEALMTLRDYAAQRQTGEVTNLRSAQAYDQAGETLDTVHALLDSFPEATDE